MVGVGVVAQVYDATVFTSVMSTEVATLVGIWNVASRSARSFAMYGCELLAIRQGDRVTT